MFFSCCDHFFAQQFAAKNSECKTRILRDETRQNKPTCYSNIQYNDKKIDKFFQPESKVHLRNGVSECRQFSDINNCKSFYKKKKRKKNISLRDRFQDHCYIVAAIIQNRGKITSHINLQLEKSFNNEQYFENRDNSDCSSFV